MHLNRRESSCSIWWARPTLIKIAHALGASEIAARQALFRPKTMLRNSKGTSPAARPKSSVVSNHAVHGLGSSACLFAEITGPV